MIWAPSGDHPIFGPIAQLGERHNGIVEVSGSIPLGSTKSKTPALSDQAGVLFLGRGAESCRGLLKDYIWSPLHIWSEAMRFSSQVKPISYLKANAAEVLTELATRREPLVITQNGEAKAVLQDVASFEETQETLALLRILALGNQEVAAGKVKPATAVIARLRSKRKPA